jgi:hypothetical protein
MYRLETGAGCMLVGEEKGDFGIGENPYVYRTVLFVLYKRHEVYIKDVV